MHRTRPTPPIQHPDIFNACKVINKNFLNHESLIKREIENGHVSMKPDESHPFKEWGAK